MRCKPTARRMKLRAVRATVVFTTTENVPCELRGMVCCWHTDYSYKSPLKRRERCCLCNDDRLLEIGVDADG
jgi:hypothetical protein